MNYYEHTIVTRQDVSDAQLNTIREKYTKLIEKHNGEVVKTENWGLIYLAYLIKKNKKGNFIHFKVTGNGEMIKELEKNEKIDKNLLRFLTVKVKKLDLETNYFSKSVDEAKS